MRCPVSALGLIYFLVSLYIEFSSSQEVDSDNSWLLQPSANDLSDDYPVLGLSDLVREIDRAISDRLRQRKLLYEELRKRVEARSLPQIHTVDTTKRNTPSQGRHKRHCWDVADVCCMWDIC